jgi:hypothetical protein
MGRLLSGDGAALYLREALIEALMSEISRTQI